MAQRTINNGEGGGAVRGKLNDNFSELYGRTNVSVKDFGAIGDGVADDTAAIQAAINAVGVSGGGVVFLPRGDYRTTSALNVSQNFVTLCGEGMGATVLVPSVAGQTGVVFQKSGGGTIEYCGISNLDIAPSVAILDCVQVIDHFWFTSERVRMPGNFTTGFNLYKGATAYLAFLHNVFTNTGAVGVRIGQSGTGDIQNVFLYNCHLNDATEAGLRIQNVGGLMWIGGESLFSERGLVIEPSASERVKGVFVTNVFLDTSNQECLRINPSHATGRVSGVGFTGVSMNFSVAGSGAVIAGPSSDPGQVERIRFDGCDFIINSLNGAYLTYCRNIDFEACHFVSNGQLTTDTYAGISLDAGVQGLRISNGSNGSGDEFSPRQRHGVSAAFGVQNVLISGVDLTGNVTAPILDNAAAGELTIVQCEGYRTSNQGAATIATGGTSVTVNHGLNATPAKEDIQVTAAADPGHRFWVSNATATQFTITTSGAVASDAFFGWSARVKGA
jgi:hypothetical protein